MTAERERQDDTATEWDRPKGGRDRFEATLQEVLEGEDVESGEDSGVSPFLDRFSPTDASGR